MPFDQLLGLPPPDAGALGGKPLKLRFTANRYGPYADALRHVLVRIEGHYLTGFGDGSSKVVDAAPLTPTPGAVAEAENVLDAHRDSWMRVESVLDLAQGYEAAYGMKLLATVHWLATRAPAGTSEEAIAAKVADWSPRKARMFTPLQVARALQTLRSHQLLTDG